MAVIQLDHTLKDGVVTFTVPGGGKMCHVRHVGGRYAIKCGMKTVLKLSDPGAAMAIREMLKFGQSKVIEMVLRTSLKRSVGVAA